MFDVFFSKICFGGITDFGTNEASHLILEEKFSVYFASLKFLTRPKC